MWSTNDPEWGILSTPAISADKTTLFAVAWHDEGPRGFAYRLHALDLKNGTDRHAPVIVGTSSSDVPSPCKRQNTFNPCVHKQRAALLLSEGVVYAAFGGDGNRGPSSLLTHKPWSKRLSGVRLRPVMMAVSGNLGRAPRQMRKGTYT
jgi:hypothetical protein